MCTKERTIVLVAGVTTQCLVAIFCVLFVQRFTAARLTERFPQAPPVVFLSATKDDAQERLTLTANGTKLLQWIADQYDEPVYVHAAVGPLRSFKSSTLTVLMQRLDRMCHTVTSDPPCFHHQHSVRGVTRGVVAVARQLSPCLSNALVELNLPQHGILVLLDAEGLNDWSSLESFSIFRLHLMIVFLAHTISYHISSLATRHNLSDLRRLRALEMLGRGHLKTLNASRYDMSVLDAVSKQPSPHVVVLTGSASLIQDSALLTRQNRFNITSAYPIEMRANPFSNESLSFYALAVPTSVDLDYILHSCQFDGANRWQTHGSFLANLWNMPVEWFIYDFSTAFRTNMHLLTQWLGFSNGLATIGIFNVWQSAEILFSYVSGVLVRNCADSYLVSVTTVFGDIFSHYSLGYDRFDGRRRKVWLGERFSSAVMTVLDMVNEIDGSILAQVGGRGQQVMATMCSSVVPPLTAKLRQDLDALPPLLTEDDAHLQVSNFMTTWTDSVTMQLKPFASIDENLQWCIDQHVPDVKSMLQTARSRATALNQYEWVVGSFGGCTGQCPSQRQRAISCLRKNGVQLANDICARTYQTPSEVDVCSWHFVWKVYRERCVALCERCDGQPARPVDCDQATRPVNVC